MLTGNITGGSPQNRKKFMVTPDGSPMTWSIDSSGTLTVTVADATQLYNAIQSARDGIPLVITITQGFTITESTEILKIQNGRDITVKDNGTRITLDCKNRPQDKHKFFCVENGGKLTLQGEITLKGVNNGNKEQYALYVEKFGTAEIKNTVEITGFLNNGYGCVYIEGTLTMSGGKIAGNKARWGGGVYIAYVGIFEMKGGSIESNQAENLGRAMYISGTFNWTGGTITGHGGLLMTSCITQAADILITTQIRIRSQAKGILLGGNRIKSILSGCLPAVRNFTQNSAQFFPAEGKTYQAVLSYLP